MKAFFDWLFQTKKSGNLLSKKKEKQFRELKSIWEESSKIKLPEAPDNQQEWTKLQRAIRHVEDGREDRSFNPFPLFVRKPKFAVAFSFIILAAIAATFLYVQTNPAVYATAKQEKTKVILADGSTVHLNSGSRFSVSKNFGEDSRAINLQGEAYFEVQESSIPFQVQTELGMTTVLGTKFNVYSRNHRMEVAVIKGSVKVTSTVSPKDSSVIVTQGELSLCESGKYPTTPQLIGFKEYPGWLYNKMTLKEAELSQVLQEVERRFDVKIVQNEKALDQLKISGLFEASDVDSLMSALCLLIQKEYRQENEKIIIY
jgi:ferric-dicitrate binding protein FerR (iron transport regulator)